MQNFAFVLSFWQNKSFVRAAISLLTVAVVLTSFLIYAPINTAQAAAPTFTVKWKAGQNKVALIFSEPVHDGANPPAGLTASDFMLAGTDTLAGGGELTISGITHAPGNQEVVLTLSGNLAIGGANEVTIACASAQVKNFMSESCGTTATDLNNVAQDTTGPSIVSVEFFNATTVFVELSEPATSNTLTTSNFTLTTSSTTDNSAVTSINIFSDGVQLTASGASATFGSGNTVAISTSVTDVLGNASAGGSATILPSINISEVKIGSSTNSKDEFIELYNPGSAAVNLSTFKLHLFDGTTDTSLSPFTTAHVIEPQKFFLIAHSNNSLSVTPDATYTHATAHLVANGAAYISLSATADTDVIDKVGWGTSSKREGTAAADIALDSSIERRANFDATTASQMAAGGAFEFKGNSFDTDQNLFDFVVQSTQVPQNTGSGGEFPWGSSTNQGTGDTTAPTVTGSFPSSGSQVPADMDFVGANFSEPMLASTLNTTNVKVTAASAPSVNLCQSVVPQNNAGTVQCQLNPTGTLASETHTLTITTAVTDVAGIALAANYTATFTPTASMNFTNSMPPMIRGSFPTPNTNTFPSNAQKMYVSFSDGMSTSSFTGKVSLLNTTTNASTALTGLSFTSVDDTNDALAISLSGVTLTQGTKYRLVFATGITSADGGAFPMTSCPNTSCIEFTVGAADASVPTIVGREPAQGATANVGQPFVFVRFDDALDQTTVTSSRVQLLQGSDVVSATVSYDAAFKEIGIERSSAFAPSTTYTVRLAASGNAAGSINNISGVALADTDGTSDTWQTFTFATGSADTTAPDVLFAQATEDEITVTFNEPVKESTSTASDSVTNVANWSLQSPTGTEVILSALAGTEVNWDPVNNTARIRGGISLTANATFRITAGTGIRDLSGNALASAVSREGTVTASSAGGSTGPGGTYTGDRSGNAGNFSGTTHGFVPQAGVMPMNAMAGKTSTYHVNIPISKQVRSNTNSGKIILTFPSGFNVGSAASMASSFSNSDINGPGPGTVGIQAVTPDAQARTITITLTSATRCDTGNTDPCGSSTSGVQNDFLDFDLSDIVNTSTPASWDTAGYSVDIKTMTGSTLLESVTSMPFFINAAGSNTLNVNLTAAGMTSGTVVVRAFAPSTGEMQATANFATNANGTATAQFTGLTSDFYRIWTDPVLSLGGGTDNFQGILNGNAEVRTTTVNFAHTLASTSSLGTITVNVNGLSGKDLDVMAGGPNGWTMKRIAATDGSDTVALKVASGDWNVGVMPHMPTDGGFIMPKPPDYITTPQFFRVTVNTTPNPDTFVEQTSSGSSDGTNDGTVTFTLSSAGLTLPITVVDGDNKTVVNAMVWASDSTNGYGTFGNTDATGKVTLNVTAGTYGVGASLPGAPPSGQKQVRVESDGDIFVEGTATAVTTVTLKVAKSDYSITGTVTDGTNPVSGAGVHAWCTANCDGYRDAGNMTDSTGAYTLYVGNGTWKVEAFSPSFGRTVETTVIVSGANQTGINLAPTSGVTFNTISGTVCRGASSACNEEGASGVGGVEVRALSTAAGGGENRTITNSDGTYSLRVPAATGYRLEARDMRSGIDYPAKTGINTSSGNVSTGTDFVLGSLRTVTINVKNSGGTAVSVNDMFIELFSTTTTTNSRTMIKNASSTTLSVPDGSYLVRAHMNGLDLNETTAVATDDAVNTTVASGIVTVNGNETIKVTVPALRTISGTVTDETNPVADAWVQFRETTSGSMAGTETATNGTYSMSLPDGTYEVAAYGPDIFMTSVTLVVDGTETQNLTATRTTLTISGTLRDPSGNLVTEACIEGQRQGGGTTGTCAEGDGTYSLPVAAGTWTLTAYGHGFAPKAYGSDLVVSSASLTDKNITFTTAVTGLADPTSTAITPSEGGAGVDEALKVTVTVPPNSVSTSSSAGTLVVQETTEAGDTARTDVVGDEPFSIEMSDAGGTALTSNFTDNLTIEREMTVAALVALGIDTLSEVEDLTISYYSRGTWISEPTTATALDANGAVVTSPLENLSNVTSFVFSTEVDHLTVFAITTPSDGLAPATPTGVSATGGNSVITVSWTAVTTNTDSSAISDLAGYEVYRDTSSSGSFTTQVNTSDVTTTSFADSTVTPGTTYYYKVTAADTGGNESAKSSATSAVTTTNGGSGGSGGSGGGGGGGGGAAATTTTTTTTTTGGSAAVESTTAISIQKAETKFDATNGITVNASKQRVAGASGNQGPSPVTGKTEVISKVAPGMLVRSYAFSTIYYITETNARRPFWDATTYLTWTEDWNDVVWVTDATLTTLPLATPVLPAPGSVLVKIASDPKVYTVERNATTGEYELRWLTTEQVATDTYGENWADLIIDLDPTIFARYKRGKSVEAAISGVDRAKMKTRAQLLKLRS